VLAAPDAPDAPAGLAFVARGVAFVARVVFVARGLFVVRDVVARGVFAARGVVARARFAGAALAVAAAPASAGTVAAVGAAAKAVDAAPGRRPRFVGVVVRGLRVPVVRARVADAARRPLTAWRPRIASTRADSSAISSRTSASRVVRFARLFLVALSRRPARHDSSVRAAASANSSHSMWRVSAAAGVIARRLALDPRSVGAGAAVPGVAAPEVVLAAFMEVSLIAPDGRHCHPSTGRTRTTGRDRWRVDGRLDPPLRAQGDDKPAADDRR
jgi:hypothetical protein